MAEGNRSSFEIVPRKDASLFHMRVSLSPPDDTRSAGRVIKTTKTVVAGCECTAYCADMMSGIDVMLSFKAWPDRGLGGAPKVSPHMVLLDKTGSPATSLGTNTHREGLHILHASWDDVKANCMVDNYFLVLCSVDIDWTPLASSVKEELPDLGHCLAMMSDKQELTDVSFDVSGESLNAHRLVLAARSPVFKAELYGLMVESKMTSITVQDMEASTFKSMLH
jgi:speckle-type POZ protein